MPLLVTLEGPEGAGKSTLQRNLTQQLEFRGYSVYTAREPGGTELGLQIRQLLLNTDLEMDPLAEFLLYSASRAQLVRKVFSVVSEDIVVCDRYTDSSLAYQGYGRGLDLDMLRTLNAQVTGGRIPDLTLLLDIDCEEGLKRVASRGQKDRFERADIGFHKRVRAGFLELARLEPERIRVLDAQNGPETVATQALDTIETWITQHRSESYI
ncbi:MAG: dTMP kinase [Deinococcaceae bacterium]